MREQATRQPPGGFFAVENLSKHFHLRSRNGPGLLRAVDDVSFTLAPGETMAIVGESGCGKSTLARTILRLLDPTAGAVWLRDRNLFDLGAEQMRAARRHVQMIFQDPYASLHPRRTVAEAIAEPWHVHRGLVDRRDHVRRVAELLEQVGLSPAYADAYPNRLSGGERQRVAIARALAMRPEVLILDEPVSALDVSIQAQVIKLLMSLQQELGMAYIFISHDLPLVRLVSNKVAVMYGGRFVEFGEAEDVYGFPMHPYTRTLLGASLDAIAEDGASRPEMGERRRVPDGEAGCRFHSRCWKAVNRCAVESPDLSVARRGDHGCACFFPENAEMIGD